MKITSIQRLCFGGSTTFAFSLLWHLQSPACFASSHQLSLLMLRGFALLIWSIHIQVSCTLFYLDTQVAKVLPFLFYYVYSNISLAPDHGG